MKLTRAIYLLSLGLPLAAQNPAPAKLGSAQFPMTYNLGVA